MSLPKDKAWFAAKRYGYGWGLPARWQGWVVFAGYLIALLVLSLVVAPRNAVAFIVCLIALSLVMVAICSWKGETPRWRWGGEPDDEQEA